jgi:hypothetical protein
MACCVLLAAIDAGNLVSQCNSTAAGCNDAQCMQGLRMSLGGVMCP